MGCVLAAKYWPRSRSTLTSSGCCERISSDRFDWNPARKGFDSPLLGSKTVYQRFVWRCKKRERVKDRVPSTSKRSSYRCPAWTSTGVGSLPIGCTQDCWLRTVNREERRRLRRIACSDESASLLLNARAPSEFALLNANAVSMISSTDSAAGIPTALSASSEPLPESPPESSLESLRHTQTHHQTHP